ncbi:hypothetical protein ACWOFR_16300 [Carnobacterium gallinarum]|uniref:hypothetical protein n=1 Tax=Carnobacterium gallinarum TaxID=2749 RepID=UPI0005513DD9|nr:hypothetical protein [Carnobacterium gallinarum]
MDEHIRKEILDFIWSERLLDNADLQSTPDAEEHAIRIVNKKGEIIDVSLDSSGEMHLMHPEKSIFAFEKDENNKWKPTYFKRLGAHGQPEELFNF